MPRSGKVCKFLSCTSTSRLYPEKKFYPFVKPWVDLEKCLRWISATGKKDLTPVFIDKHTYVCQDHFVNGAPSAENPDPLPHDFLASVVNFPKDHIEENPNIREDHSEASIDISTDQHIHKNPCACKDLNDASSSDNPDLVQHGFQAGMNDTPKQVTSLLKPSPSRYMMLQKRQTAVKKKSYSPKKNSRMMKAPYKVPTSWSEVTGINKDVKETVSNPRLLTQNVHSHVQHTGNGLAQTEKSSSSLLPDDNSTPTNYVENGCNLHIGRFERFIMDVLGSNRDGNEQIFSPWGDTFQNTSSGSREVSGVIEKAGKSSVDTQTRSRTYGEKLIVADKLSKCGAKSKSQSNTVECHHKKREKRPRVVTINTGGQITILKRDDEEDYEGGGAPSKMGTMSSEGLS